MEKELIFDAEANGLNDLNSVELLNIEGGGFWKDVGKGLGHWYNFIQDNMNNGYSVMEFMGGA